MRDEGVVMDPGVSPQDFSGRPSQHEHRSNNGAISKQKDKHNDKDKDKDNVNEKDKDK